MKKGIVIISAILMVLQCMSQQENNASLKLWYYQPAVKWIEALPIGNGRLGAMVFGGVKEDRIQFNEETLWTGEPRDYHRTGAADHLEAIRKLLNDGKQKEAEQLAEQKFMGLRSNEGSKADWVKKVTARGSGANDMASAGYDDSKWKTIDVPTYEGWETVGLELDGAVWYRTTFELPAQWNGRDLVLDLNRIRDHDFTYINGKLAGTLEGGEARKYVIKKELLQPGKNTIAILVLNYFDKGGIAGYKDTARHIGIYPEGEESAKISLVKKWKYFIHNDEPPAVPRYQADYQPFGDLWLHVKSDGEVSDYKRALDLNKAIITTSYSINGVKYSRDYFSGAPAGLIVIHLTADKKRSLNFKAGLTSPHKNSVTKKINDHTLRLSLAVRNGALKGVSYLYADHKGGKLTITDDNITVADADEVTLYLSAATNYVNYKNVSGNADLLAMQPIQAVKNKSVDLIQAAHIKEYTKLFNTFSIDLGATKNELLPTNERIEKFSKGSDPSLVSLFVQYGRYLLISSSRPGTRPANLQGIWNDLLTPPWGSKYTTNINAEMNYWPSDVMNLLPMHKPLFEMTKELALEGRKTAKAHYNARGWVLHHNTDLWRGTAPINASNHGIWVTGGAWLCHHLWDRYLFTNDRDFLKKEAYPVMKEAALFFVDFLIKDPKTGWLISTPSNSPENGGLVAGPTMDHQIIRDLFNNTIQASVILNTDTGLRKILQEKYDQLAPNQVGKFGQLQEWLEDKDDTANKHRHVSHLWGVYPGSEINWEESPKLMQAARQSLIYRGDAGTGWSLAWKINLWARFKDGEHAFKMVRTLISPAAKGGGAYPNLFDAHPPFQIDGNFGGAAGIAEMFVQSHTKFLDILPALPNDLPDGNIKGIRARGGFVLDFEWKQGKLKQVAVFSESGNECRLRYNGKTKTFNTQKGKWYYYDGTLNPLSKTEVRTVIPLDDNWRTIAHDDKKEAFNGFELASFSDKQWTVVDVPHNWDAYEGYRRMRHGNRHGYAWYRKTFELKTQTPGKRYFLFFEGVGSYATVWLNGKKAGYHAGGRTSFTIDVTDLIQKDKPNLLAVRADHPANIKDLPWVCGGCSDERGFSEGSQPMGIFRPVHLVITDPVRVEPFGVHIWNAPGVSPEKAQLNISTELKNYGSSSRNIVLKNSILNRDNDTVASVSIAKNIKASDSITIKQQLPVITNPHLWSVDDPYLYSMVTEVQENGKVIDRIITPYGIRWISWPVGRKDSTNQFLLNGKPVFINGIAEYEHLIGNSHAFSAEQIRTRVMQMKAAGFNAFRDAHQPHNLRYNQYWDELGFLWWTQISAHVWYDSPEFRNNFKTLLKEWVKERRNSPSVVLWGLQNESKLPEDFARECMELIRQLDPTASSERKVVTCNGGSGTDWDVPQNWTGTYGGDPLTYGADLQRQILIGEYGAWRTIDLHTEGPFVQNGIYSEDRMTQLMEMKVRLADSVKDKTSGHFMWLHTSHDNPGRVQGGEGFREPDRIGPVNYKGLLTPWEEPLDVFYMYRSNFAPKEKEPMVYIVSHTWPDRWTSPGMKNGIVVYSNCDEVELFNDLEQNSLGKRKRGKIGTHFQWDGVNIQFNVLYAVGYINGKAVAKDLVVFRHLPEPPNFKNLYKDAAHITTPQQGYKYIYRLNCGGGSYTDQNGNEWMADRRKSSDTTVGSTSWTTDFAGMPAFFASQRKSNDPIKGTKDWKLFQSFRYGRDKLKFHFPVPDGKYLVELYFIEPWLGTGGGMDCTGWRLFDVAVNGHVMIRDLDIWKEVGHDAVLKKTVMAEAKGGQLIISFPRVRSGQAVISAIAIASANTSITPASQSVFLTNVTTRNDSDKQNPKWTIEDWLDAGDRQYTNSDALFVSVPPDLYGAVWIRQPDSTLNTVSGFKLTEETDVYIGLDSLIKERPSWLKEYEDTKTKFTNSKGTIFRLYRKRYGKGAQVSLGPNEKGNVRSVSMYSIFLVPVNTIEPAYDLKPVTSYKALAAKLNGPGLGIGKVDGRERVIFNTASQDNFIEWEISVGVADIYSLTITYNNPHQRSVKAKVDLFAADGTLMKTEEVELTPTRAGKSNYINSSTGNMINAGKYKVRLSSATAEKVSVNALDVQ